MNYNNQNMDGSKLFRAIINNPKLLASLPVKYKYDKDFLELLYIIWGDKIEPYIPSEMFETLKNEALMHEYHQKHKQKQKQWIKEVQEKILSKNKNC